MGEQPDDGAQDIHFARSADGVRIAYAVHGAGPALLLDSCWLSHLQFDWQSPVWRHYLEELGKIATVVRFDERGHGLSDRGVTDHSLASRVADLEAVADAAGLERFAMLAMSQGGPVALEYAARHPHRLSRLVLYGTYAAMLGAASQEERDLDDVFQSLIRVGWDRPTPEFRRVFTMLMIPGADERQMRWLDDLQRVATDAETAILARSQRQMADSRHRLAELRMPTLVLHSRNDQMNGFEHSRYLAAHIRGSRLVALDSDNHIVLAGETAWPVLLHELTDFLTAEPPDPTPVSERHDAVTALLSPRELSILKLAARGDDNASIARELVLSVRTVERHVQNIYTKLDLRGRNARTAAVVRLLAELPVP